MDELISIETGTEISMKENELYQEIELFHGQIKIGEAEVDLKNHMLAKLCIFEPYQNLGLGTKAVKMLTEEYNLDNLWVNAENSRAIHVYEKCGFKISRSTMYEMVRTLEMASDSADGVKGR